MNPAVAMSNMAGDLSFTKGLIVAFVVAHWTGYTFSAIGMTILLSAAFGKSTWESFLARGQWSATETHATEDKTITERRIVTPGEPGIEPS